MRVLVSCLTHPLTRAVLTPRFAIRLSFANSQ